MLQGLGQGLSLFKDARLAGSVLVKMRVFGAGKGVRADEDVQGRGWCQSRYGAAGIIQDARLAGAVLRARQN